MGVGTLWVTFCFLLFLSLALFFVHVAEFYEHKFDNDWSVIAENVDKFCVITWQDVIINFLIIVTDLINGIVFCWAQLAWGKRVWFRGNLCDIPYSHWLSCQHCSLAIVYTQPSYLLVVVVLLLCQCILTDRQDSCLLSVLAKCDSVSQSESQPFCSDNVQITVPTCPEKFWNWTWVLNRSWKSRFLLVLFWKKRYWIHNFLQ